MILLLQNGANAFAQNHRGHTALHRAAFAGHTHVVRALLDHSLRLLDAVDNDGRSALILALEADEYNVVDQLLELLNRDEKRALVRREDVAGNSPLSLAAGAGRVKLVKEFLPFATKLQIIRAQVAVCTVGRTKRRVQIHHMLFTALVERCHGWTLPSA